MKIVELLSALCFMLVKTANTREILFEHSILVL